MYDDPQFQSNRPVARNMSPNEMADLKRKIMWCRGLVFDVTKRGLDNTAHVMLWAIYNDLSNVMHDLVDLGNHLDNVEDTPHNQAMESTDDK